MRTKAVDSKAGLDEREKEVFAGEDGEGEAWTTAGRFIYTEYRALGQAFL